MRALVLTAFIVGLFAVAVVDPAAAGCGCEKPPPVPAMVRPAAAYAGLEVTLFHPALVPGETYSVVFGSGTTEATAAADAIAIARRDLADGVVKPQLRVTVPDLPLGPTSLKVGNTLDSGLTLAIRDDGFTVIPLPVVVPAEKGQLQLSDYQAAVGRDGVVYLSLDMSLVTHPMVFRAQAKEYPLRFTGEDAIFYNIQGFVMQRLDGSIPGLFSVDALNSAVDSDVLQYSRHEFNTFYLQHEERQPHEVDGDDSAWHLDGTPHIDHDHLVLALSGVLPDGSTPAAGATPPMTLLLEAFSFFQHAIAATGSLTMSDQAYTRAYDSREQSYAATEGDVLCDGTVTLGRTAVVDGDATARAFDFSNISSGVGGISKSTTIIETSPEFMPVSVPRDLEHLGTVQIGGNPSVSGNELTLVGPATYEVDDLIIAHKGNLIIDNSLGPVTLYVNGAVITDFHSKITVVDKVPETFSIYVSGPGPVLLQANDFVEAVIYAPQAFVELSRGIEFNGAIVGCDVRLLDRALINYDIALRGSPIIRGNQDGGFGKSADARAK